MSLGFGISRMFFFKNYQESKDRTDNIGVRYLLALHLTTVMSLTPYLVSQVSLGVITEHNARKSTVRSEFTMPPHKKNTLPQNITTKLRLMPA